MKDIISGDVSAVQLTYLIKDMVHISNHGNLLETIMIRQHSV